MQARRRLGWAITAAATAALALPTAGGSAPTRSTIAQAHTAGAIHAAARCTIRGWTFTRRRGIGCRRAFSVWGFYLDDGRPPRGWTCTPTACRKRGTAIRFRAVRTLRTPA